MEVGKEEVLLLVALLDVSTAAPQSMSPESSPSVVGAFRSVTSSHAAAIPTSSAMSTQRL